MRSKGEGINNPLPARRAFLCLCARGAPSSSAPSRGAGTKPSPRTLLQAQTLLPWGQPAAPSTASSPRQRHLVRMEELPGLHPRAEAHRVQGAAGKEEVGWVSGQEGLGGARCLPRSQALSHQVLLWAPQTPKGAGSSQQPSEGKPKPEGFLMLGCISGGRLHGERGTSPQPCRLLGRVLQQLPAV